MVPDANLGPLKDGIAQTRPMGTLGGGDGPRVPPGAPPKCFCASNTPSSAPKRAFSLPHSLGTLILSGAFKGVMMGICVAIYVQAARFRALLLVWPLLLLLPIKGLVNPTHVLQCVVE